MDAEKIKKILIAEAEGLLQKMKVMNSLSSSALNYELLKVLPDIYKNISMGEVTIFENTGTNNSGFNFIGNIVASVLSMMKKNKFEDSADTQLVVAKKDCDNIEGKDDSI